MRNFLSKTILPKKIFKSIVKVVASTAFAIGLSSGMNFAHARYVELGANAPMGILTREYVEVNLCDATEIKISSNVTKIGDKAFSNFRKLTNIDVSNCKNLTCIGSYAFHNTGLTSADLSGCTHLNNIEKRAFKGCTNLREIKLPASLKGQLDTCFAEGYTINFV